MSASTKDDEKRLRRYLLKLAPEEELDRIEEAYLSTSEYANQLSDAENGLVSDYVQGRLSAEEDRAFETNYLVTQERQEQVAIARALGEMTEPAGERVSLWRRFLEWMTVPGPALRLAVVAAGVVLVFSNGVLFLGWRNQARQTQIASQQVRELRAVNEKPRPPASGARVLTVPVLRVDEANLSLRQVPNLSFRLPADLPDSVEIPVELPPSSEGAVIDATLSASGQVVWSVRAVSLRGSGGVQITELSIPFADIEPHLAKPLELRVVERGHAVLAVFLLTIGRQE